MQPGYFVLGSQGAGRKGKLDVHIRSETHQSSLQRYLNFKERKNNVDYMLDKNLQQQEQQKIERNKLNEEVINILIDCCRYLARQGLAFRGHEHEEGNFHQLVYLLSRHNSLLNDWIKNINNRPFKVNMQLLSFFRSLCFVKRLICFLLGPLT